MEFTGTGHLLDLAEEMFKRRLRASLFTPILLAEWRTKKTNIVSFATSRTEEAHLPALLLSSPQSKFKKWSARSKRSPANLKKILGNLQQSVFSDTSRLDKHTDIFKSDIVILVISQNSG
jgi:hypothetical protein